jgi:hypothetical protein
MSFFIGMINKSFVLFNTDSMNHLTFKLGQATPKTALQPFLGWPGCKSGSLRPFPTPSDTPCRRGLELDVQNYGSGGLGTATDYTNKTERLRNLYHQMIKLHFPIIDYLWKNAFNTSFATWPGTDEE